MFSQKLFIKTALATVAIAMFGNAALAQTADPVVLTFATVGDSRQDPVTLDVSQANSGAVNNTGVNATNLTGLTGQDAHWLNNTKAITRIFRTISSHKANLLFFNGDMVMGYGNGTALPHTTNSKGVGFNNSGVWTPANLPAGLNTDTTDFYQQYSYWRGMTANLMETGTYVVPVPGNHETQCKSCGKIAIQGNENIWRDQMSDLILDTNRLISITGAAATDVYWDPSNKPNIGDTLANSEPSKTYTTDQTGLSYSFDFKGHHFAIVNTDAVGVDARAPAVWLANDFAAASARAQAAGKPAPRFFVFGHKPAHTYQYVNPTTGKAITTFSGIDNTIVTLNGVAAPYNRNDFWSVIEQYNATYFSGHEHIFNVQQPNLATLGSSAAYEVLVGSGGSPFEEAISPAANPVDRMYAWAEVRIHQSGSVQLTAYGFDENYGSSQVLANIWLH
ncbi:hypothetical protein AAKU67_003041 [Oxalobacteraceae bacterium GrIS 2.11]